MGHWTCLDSYPYNIISNFHLLQCMYACNYKAEHQKEKWGRQIVHPLAHSLNNNYSCQAWVKLKLGARNYPGLPHSTIGLSSWIIFSSLPWAHVHGIGLEAE